MARNRIAPVGVAAFDMIHTKPPHRFAGAAIAAVLALGSTPLWAQDIAPVAAPSAPVAAPVVQPTIVLPPVTAAPVAPVVTAAPQPVSEPAAPRATTPRAAAPVARAAPARAAPTVVPSDPIAAEPLETPTAELSAPTTAAPMEPTASAEPLAEQTAAPAEGDSSNVLPLAGLLAALGLGGIALFAARRRRRQPDEVEPVIVARQPVPAVPPRAERAPSPVVATPAFVAPVMRLEQSTQQARPIWQEPRRTVSAPATAQASSHNRQALLDRMVAAEPDANNPFTSAKARRRRARLMLQSMDNQRWDDTELEAGFDWREQARATRERETVSA